MGMSDATVEAKQDTKMEVEAVPTDSEAKSNGAPTTAESEVKPNGVSESEVKPNGGEKRKAEPAETAEVTKKTKVSEESTKTTVEVEATKTEEVAVTKA